MNAQQIIDIVWSADLAPKQELKEYCRGQIHDVLRTMVFYWRDQYDQHVYVAMLWLIAQVEALQLDHDSLVEQNKQLRSQDENWAGVVHDLTQRAKND